MILQEQFSFLRSIHQELYMRSHEDLVCVSTHGRTMENQLQEMKQEHEGATVRNGEVEREIPCAEEAAEHILKI